jgi:putative heme transporter
MPSRRQLLNVAIIVGSVGWLAWLIVTEHSQLGKAIAGLGHARGGLIFAAYACERLSIIALGRMQRRLLRAGHHQLTLTSVLGIVIAGNALSVSVPIAGAGLGAAFSFKEFERHKVSHHAAAFALAVSGVLSTATLMVIVAIGALISGNRTAAIFGLLGAVAIGALLAGTLLALHVPVCQRAVERVAVRTVRLGYRVRRKPPDRAELVVAETRERLAALHLSRSDWAAAIYLAFANWLGDAACLTLAIRAAGLAIPFRKLLLVWSAGQAAGTIGLTPGGVGIVEVALIAALTGAGEPAAGSTVAVLIYRLISLWLVLLIGWIIFIVLRSHRSRTSAAVTDAPEDSDAEPTSRRRWRPRGLRGMRFGVATR